ncbi:hypothetical protein B0H11DRAFT_2375398 [Mycena galericulata]|nr:hypothetical protein B0H11DRAFT_2375398 [Mycena galericulata]
MARELGQRVVALPKSHGHHGTSDLPALETASAGQPTDDGANSCANASKTPIIWLDGEVKAMQTTLSEKKETHMSGNGYKPQVWASVVTKVNEANPEVNPKKDKQKCMNKLIYPEAPQLRKIFGLYLFVQKFSGSEWDDEAKDFVKTYGDDEYSHCFKSPCPYRIDLDSLYHGNINKATGDNVEHLEKRKRTVRKENSNIIVSNATAPNPNASSTTHTPRTPLDPISTNLWTNSATPTQTGAAANESTFDDELDVLRTSFPAYILLLIHFA